MKNESLSGTSQQKYSNCHDVKNIIGIVSMMVWTTHKISDFFEHFPWNSARTWGNVKLLEKLGLLRLIVILNHL